MPRKKINPSHLDLALAEVENQIALLSDARKALVAARAVLPAPKRQYTPKSSEATPDLSRKLTANFSDPDNVEHLELSERSNHCLKAAGIDRVTELVKWTPTKLLHIKHFGKTCLAEVQSNLAGLGLSLAEENHQETPHGNPQI